MVRIHPDRLALPPLAVVSALTLSLLTSACSPALNWREVHPAQADGLTAQFPCKPDVHERVVPWPGLPAGATMHMLSCQTEAGTWALSYLTLPDVTLLAPALHEFTMSMRRNLGSAAQLAGGGRPVSEQDLGPIVVPGMTATPQARAWHFQSQRPDGLGRPMDMDIRTWHFSHGMTVFQASVWRPLDVAKAQTSEDVAQAFFNGLQFPR
ncbi:hypothetical protein [Aquabacterium sp. NJ1]|uniref:hypothetical protein n=1 Tax=Aquabacterium sp. NJ1 TaxID=1538295 RepID=UPI000691B9D2|nr:hypothetical protein [Aquabacterium sp. NJ1]